MDLFFGMLTGAALLTGGFFFGFKIREWVNKEKAENPPARKRTRKPKCYVIEPKDFGEEERTE